MIDIIDKYRSYCSFFIKLDIGLLTITGTIATIFKLGQLEALRFIVEIKWYLLAIIILLVFGLIFDYYLLSCWKDIKTHNNVSNKCIDRINKATVIQLLLHLLFITFIAISIVFGVGGYIRGYDEGKALATLQNEIESFAIKDNRFPVDINELLKISPSIETEVNILGYKNIQYASYDTNYILRHAGRDKRLNTKDDYILDHKDFIKRRKP